MTKDIGVLQTLLNAEAAIGNLLYNTKTEDAIAQRTKKQIHIQIVNLRGTEPPVCHHEDDCSTQILSMCPWRIDC